VQVLRRCGLVAARSGSPSCALAAVLQARFPRTGSSLDLSHRMRGRSADARTRNGDVRDRPSRTRTHQMTEPTGECNWRRTQLPDRWRKVIPIPLCARRVYHVWRVDSIAHMEPVSIEPQSISKHGLLNYFQHRRPDVVSRRRSRVERYCQLVVPGSRWGITNQPDRKLCQPIMLEHAAS
jgi:hypothetical protein